MKLNKTFKKAISLLLTIIMILSTMVVGMVTVNAASGVVGSIYFVPTEQWKSDGARFAAMFYNSSKSELGWMSMAYDDSSGTYNCAVNSPASAKYVRFVRMNGSTTENKWDNKWNSTTYVSLPTDGKNKFTLNTQGDGWVDEHWTDAGSWSAVDVSWFVTGRFAIKNGTSLKWTVPSSEDSSHWCSKAYSDLEFTKSSTDLYKLETNLSVNEIVSNYGNYNWYFHIGDGTTNYYPSATVDWSVDEAGTKSSLLSTNSSANNVYIGSKQSSTSLVTLWLDTSTRYSPKVYFTLTAVEPTTVKVPNVVGKTQAEAKTAIEALGLTVNVTESYSDTVDAGSVISSNPVANTDVEAGSSVTIVVSKGPEPTDPNKVTITNVVGKTQAEATTILTDLGLTVKVTEAYSDKVPAGTVISSSPTAGSSVNKGSEVTITVSKGPEETVPPSTDPTVPSGTVLNNVKVYFKGTNLTSLTPSLTINGKSYTLAKDNYIGTYFNGSYRFYWWTTTISTVTVGQTYTFNFKTSGSSMNATADIDFSVYNEDDNAIYLAVDNMQTGTEIVNISNNDTAKKAFRSSANMITNVTSQFDPNKKLASAMLTLLNADGTTTTKKYSIGDTNADGSVNIKDATTAQMMSAGYVQETSTNSILGDFDVSGDVNIKDSTGIQTYIVYN